jgi:hypothetical protein
MIWYLCRGSRQKSRQACRKVSFLHLVTSPSAIHTMSVRLLGRHSADGVPNANKKQLRAWARTCPSGVKALRFAQSVTSRFSRRASSPEAAERSAP